MKRLAVLALASACVQPFNLAHDMETWVGHSQTDLIEQRGAPDLSADLPDGGGKVLTYVVKWTENPGRRQHECRESYTVSPAGKILRWSLAGACD